MTAFVSGTTESDDLDWLDSLNDLLDLFTEVGKRGGNLNVVVLLWLLLVVEWLDRFDISCEKVVFAHVFIIGKFESSKLS